MNTHLLVLRGSENGWNVGPACGKDKVLDTKLVKLKGRVGEEGVEADEDAKAHAEIGVKVANLCLVWCIEDGERAEDVLLVVAGDDQPAG